MEKEVATHSSTLAWKIPWMEEPGRLQSMGSLRVRHDWRTSLSLFTFMHWRKKWQPTPVFLPGESQGRGSLVGCCLWGRTESDTTEATQQQQQHRSWYVCVLSLVWLCDLKDSNLPGASVHGFFQARILEWVAISSSRGFSWPRDRTSIFWVSRIGRQVHTHTHTHGSCPFLLFSLINGNILSIICWWRCRGSSLIPKSSKIDNLSKIAQTHKSYFWKN